MTSIIPITLQGKHLGERHQYLNTLVGDTFERNEPIETILNSPESGPVDRLFKIELASKHRRVDYILDNLRDDDMLYVSKALKCKWLMEDAYQHIIHPNYLEDVLYPNMITPAVNKTKHWIHLNLRDPARCKEFYEFYSHKDTNLAIKYLSKCSPEIVEKECLKWFAEMSPEYFKILCEKNAVVARLFFESLKKKKSLRDKYFKHKNKYFDGVKCILKADPDIYLDIVEKIKWQFPQISPTATKFIMMKKKDRFLQKAELYAVKILHMDTLALCLSPEECENLVLKLARAKFLEEKFGGWFTYKNVEPLIKRLDEPQRASFKKRVFVEKNIGDEVKEWPYPIIESEDEDDSDEDDTPDVFEDNEWQPSYYDRLFSYELDDCFAECIAPRCMACCKCADYDMGRSIGKSFLDMLFDEYRFMNFDETLKALQKKIGAESIPKNRMSMFLVLVSKTGGNTESLKKLIKLMMHHRNEPAHVRAAVVRSLVKRTSIWRAPDDVWESLMMFAEGLGLDGAKADCECVEGLHAVVIRSLLSNKECEAAIKTAFRNKFSTMTTYSLTSAEKDLLFHNLVKLLLDSARSAAEPYVESCLLMDLLDTIRDYNRKVGEDVIMIIKSLAAKDKPSAERILHRLFESRIRRKELFKENFALIHTTDSYTNALKHDAEVLVAEDFANQVISKGLKADLFLRKINIYFTESQGIQNLFLVAMKNAKIDKNTCKSKLARTISYLIGSDLKSYIIQLDAVDSKESKLLAAQVRGQAHVARPALSVDCTEWRQFGAKHVANRVLVCRQADVHTVIQQLLLWPRTAKLAVVLSKGTKFEVDTLEAVAKIRPTVALKYGVKYMQQNGDKYDPRVWDIIKPLMKEVSKKSIDRSHCLKRYFKDIDKIPLKLKAEFVILALNIFNEFGDPSAVTMLCHAKLILAEIDENIIRTILLDYLDNELILEKIQQKQNNNDMIASLYLNILGKHLLICKTEEAQNERFEKVGLLYLNRLESLWKSKENKKTVLKYVDQLLKSLKYTKAFLNNEYIDSVPLMGKIATWMQSILPMEQHFNMFVDLHLTMSYCRAVRQSVKQAPEAFSAKKTKLNEGVKIVGEIFGKYISHEAHELRTKYYDSIIELYSKYLRIYISNYFVQSTYKMELHIMKGLLLSAHDIECYLGINMFNKFIYRGEKKDLDEIREIMKQRNDIASQFVFHCIME